jgi:hypothetical protein
MAKSSQVMNKSINPSIVKVIPFSKIKDINIDDAFEQHYSQNNGRPSKPIRLMIGLLLLKQLENLSDERVVLQFKRKLNAMTLCQLVKAIDNLNGKFGIGGIGDIFGGSRQAQADNRGSDLRYDLEIDLKEDDFCIITFVNT